MKALSYVAVAVVAAAAGFAIYRYAIEPRVAPAPLKSVAAEVPAATEPTPQVPTVLPDFSLLDREGAKRSIRSWPGKSMIVNFWATWCAPCRDEMPSIEGLKRKLAGRPFAVLAVNLDEPESRIRKFLAQVKVNFTVLLDPDREVARAWQARVLPASFIIGPDGRVRYSLVGEINWDHELVVSRITELLPPTHK